MHACTFGVIFKRTGTQIQFLKGNVIKKKEGGGGVIGKFKMYIYIDILRIYSRDANSHKCI